FPRVRVARDRNRGDLVAASLGALRFAGRRKAADLTAQHGHAVADPAAIELDLGLTRAAGSHARARRADLTTGLAAHRVTPTAQAWEEVFELRQFDLRLALARLGVLGEDVEDDGGSVDDLHLDDVLQSAALARRELGIGDHRVGADRVDDLLQLFGLAAADIGRGIRVRAALKHAVEHHGSGRLGERCELLERVLRIVQRSRAVDADENDVLHADLAVLDLGNVFELGREAHDAAKRVAIFEIPLLAVVVDGRRVLQSLGRAEHARGAVRLVPGDDPVDGVVGACGFGQVMPFVGLAFHFSPFASQRAPLNSPLMADHYFSAQPSSPEELRQIRVALAGREVDVTTASGVFSPGHLD